MEEDGLRKAYGEQYDAYQQKARKLIPFIYWSTASTGELSNESLDSNPESFCHAILKKFTKGLVDAGHTSEVVDLYAIRFDPVFRMQDYASYVSESCQCHNRD